MGARVYDGVRTHGRSTVLNIRPMGRSVRVASSTSRSWLLQLLVLARVRVVPYRDDGDGLHAEGDLLESQGQNTERERISGVLFARRLSLSYVASRCAAKDNDTVQDAAAGVNKQHILLQSTANLNLGIIERQVRGGALRDDQSVTPNRATKRNGSPEQVVGNPYGEMDGVLQISTKNLQPCSSISLF